MTEPNLFALPPGVDFPAELVEGLEGREQDQVLLFQPIVGG